MSDSERELICRVFGAEALLVMDESAKLHDDLLRAAQRRRSLLTGGDNGRNILRQPAGVGTTGRMA
jgi:hypothetical protein